MCDKSSGVGPENLKPSDEREAAYLRMRSAFYGAQLDDTAHERFMSAINEGRRSALKREPPELD